MRRRRLTRKSARMAQQVIPHKTRPIGPQRRQRLRRCPHHRLRRPFKARCLPTARESKLNSPLNRAPVQHVIAHALRRRHRFIQTKRIRPPGNRLDRFRHARRFAQQRHSAVNGWSSVGNRAARNLARRCRALSPTTSARKVGVALSMPFFVLYSRCNEIATRSL